MTKEKIKKDENSNGERQKLTGKSKNSDIKKAGQRVNRTLQTDWRSRRERVTPPK